MSFSCKNSNNEIKKEYTKNEPIAKEKVANIEIKSKVKIIKKSLEQEITVKDTKNKKDEESIRDEIKFKTQNNSINNIRKSITALSNLKNIEQTVPVKIAIDIININKKPLFNDSDLKYLENKGALINENLEVENSESSKQNSLYIPFSNDFIENDFIENDDLVAEEFVYDPEESEEEKELTTWYDGQFRGYAMLYLMHPNAKKTVEQELRIILQSKIKNIYLSVLIDGTFGLNLEYFKEVLYRLNTNNRKIYLSIYLSNGSTMRRFDTTKINTAFSKIDPIKFREKILTNKQLQNSFISYIENANIIFQFNKELNSNNINNAVVMLEDNLDLKSYKFLYNLSKDLLVKGTLITRNPCPKCYQGNNDDSLNSILELHDPNHIERLEAGDGFTIDGTGIKYNNSNGLTDLEIKSLLDIAKEKKLRYFGLWRKERQGIGKGFIHPDNREYEIPNQNQIENEINLLRYNLKEIKQ